MSAKAASASHGPGVRQLLGQVREDYEANGRSWSKPGFQAVATHRFGVWTGTLPVALRLPCTLLYLAAYTFLRNCCGIELPRTAQVGRRLVLPHGGVVVSGGAVIGDDCMIRQGATLGSFNRGRRRKPPYAPRLGDRVQVGPGAVVVGGISIGDGARIGPNAVVMTDVPAGGSATAPPARVMPPLRAREVS